MRTGEGSYDPDAIGAGRVLGLIRDRDETTRAELVRETGLSRSTLAKRVQDLLALGLVREVDGHASTGGRPPAAIVFNQRAGFVLAADVGHARTRVAVCDLSGAPRAERVMPAGIDEAPEGLLGLVADRFRELLATARVDPAAVRGIGVGLASGWEDFAARDWLAARFEVPTLVETEVNTMALGEHRTHWREVEHLLFVEIGRTIGAGIVSGRRIHRGAQGIAGDIGHVRLPDHPDAVCRCGNTGCLEAVAGGDAVAAGLRAHGVAAANAEDVVTLVHAGEPLAVQAVRGAGRDLGSVLAQCINFYNPGAIVIGGAMADAHRQLLMGVREVAFARSLPMATRDLRMCRSRLGDRAGLIGTAIMVADHLLAPSTVDALVR
jgi:predicted NBD/HSP70 family sugar kinase